MHPKNDRFLVWARAHYGWEIEQMRGLDAGELALFVKFFVNDRFVLSGRPTYAYEIAWVFQRDRGTIGNVLRKLEEDGEVSRTADSNRKRLKLFTPTREDVESELKWLKADPGKDSDDWFKKYHDENCPCMKLV
jgi:hypothetical protein